MNSGKHFGRLLRTWRTGRHLTQQQVADTLGWDKPQVNRLELGHRQELTVEEALQLCVLIGVEIGAATSAVDVPALRCQEPDWLGRQIAAEAGLSYSVVRDAAVSIYNRDASTEHFSRCSWTDHEPGSKADSISRGNRTRRITREVLVAASVAS